MVKQRDRSIFSAQGCGSERTSPEERGPVEAWRGRKGYGVRHHLSERPVGRGVQMVPDPLAAPSGAKSFFVARISLRVNSALRVTL